MADFPSRPVFAAIDVGTNAARLELARPGALGLLERVLKERDAICPGEGVFSTGHMSEAALGRLVSTLRRYAGVCQRYQARVRAVATSALREARNQAHILQRVREETGLELEVVSGEEEARLICLGVLYRTPAHTRSLLVDLGGGSTEVVLATGERPDAMWSLPLGAVRLTQLFHTDGEVSSGQLRAMRDFIRARLGDTLPASLVPASLVALGTSGTIRALLEYAGREGSLVSREQLARATEALARLSPAQRREHFEPQRADVIVAGAALLEQLLQHLGVAGIRPDKRGLRDGLLVDLWTRRDPAPTVAPLLEGTPTFAWSPHLLGVS